jgi:hypothetical protein
MSRTTELNCTTCGKTFAAPAGGRAVELVAEESARCARLRDVNERRKALDAARIQAGFAGVLHGNGEKDTGDLVMQRDSMLRLDAALKNEAEALTAAMLHEPGP